MLFSNALSNQSFRSETVSSPESAGDTQAPGEPVTTYLNIVLPPNQGDIAPVSMASSSGSSAERSRSFVVTTAEVHPSLQVKAEAALFPEFGIPLAQEDIDAVAYEIAFARLPKITKDAVRHWTAYPFDESGVYSDGSTSRQLESEGPIRFVPEISEAINFSLARSLPLSRSEALVAQEITHALSLLPPVRGDVLRAAKHSIEHPSPWLTSLTVGDVVTPYPCFMSASVSDTFARHAADELSAWQSCPDTMVYYRIGDSRSGVPLLRGPASLSPDEHEVLFPRNSCFRVEAVSVAVPDRAPAGELRRVAVLLTEVAPSPSAKNLFSGADVRPTTAI